jgi:integrase
MHPDVLSHRWISLMEKLGLDYTFHELRHTFITRARAQYNAREVQLAAGHANITTTERYSHDHRKFDERVFEIKEANAQ